MIERVVTSVGPFRRLGAMFYDSLLVMAVAAIATLPFLPFLNGLVLVPREVGALAYFYWLWEIVVIATFFGFFWTRSGRTLGMQAWRLRIETFEGKLPTWQDACLRVAMAVVPWIPGFIALSIAERFQNKTLMSIGVVLLSLGLVNYFAAFLSVDRRAWHERWLRTRIVKI